jgi:hypothetical protein
MEGGGKKACEIRARQTRMRAPTYFFFLLVVLRRPEAPARFEPDDLRLEPETLRPSLAAFVATVRAVRRAGRLATPSFSATAFWTASAFAAIVPSVEPIDSATLVRIASSRDALLLSTVRSLNCYN